MQECGRTRHRGSRHARARPGAVAARDRRDDVDTGRRDVGLERQRVRSRPARGERCDQPGIRGDLLARGVVERERELTAGRGRLLGEARTDQIGDRERALLAIGDPGRVARHALDVDDAQGTHGQRAVGARSRAARAQLHEHERTRAASTAVGPDDQRNARLPGVRDLLGRVGGGAERREVDGHRPGPEHAERDADEATHTRGRDRDGVRRRARRGDRAPAEVVAAVARSDHRHDAGARGAMDGTGDDIVGGLHLRLAEREVEHVHPVGHRPIDRARDLGAVAVEPERRRRGGEHAVGAEEGVRCDAREVADRDTERGARDAREARGDACDVRAVLRAVGIEGRAHALAPAGRRECAGHDDLAVRPRANALREAGRVLVGGARERRPRHVDPVVDDADADTVARGGDTAVEPAPDRRCPDHRGHPIGLGRVVGLGARDGLGAIGHGGPDAAHAGHVREPAQLAARDRHDEGIHDRPHARGHAQARSRAAQPRLGGALTARDRRKREARAEPREVDVPVGIAQLRQRRVLGHRRSAQLHDDLGACGSRVRGRSGEGQQRTERDEQGTRWQPHEISVPRTRAFRPLPLIGTTRGAAGGARAADSGGRSRRPRRASCRSAA